jgi:hypothetical protein
MTLTTAPRPDPGEQLPEFAALERAAVRLHPRVGDPSAYASSVGGPPIVDPDEPWPQCMAEHWGRIELKDVDRSGVAEPMVVGLQLWRSDVPELPFRADEDVCQVLWCPLRHRLDLDFGPRVVVRWLSTVRHDGRYRPGLVPKPSAEAQGLYYLPVMCVINPERIRDFPHFEDVPNALVAEAVAWANERGFDFYEWNFWPAPGTKVYGAASTAQSMPQFMCAQQHRMDLLFSVASLEYDQENYEFWQPIEERDRSVKRCAPTNLVFGDLTNLCVFICSQCDERPITTYITG